MKIFTYSEARRNLARLLIFAQTEEVEIRRRDGSVFSVKAKERAAKSPFDVPGIYTRATTADILDAVSAVRERS